MNFKFPPPIQIWFLDQDLYKSAEYLSEKYLGHSISGCVAALICARMYFSGIRNKKFYKYYFDKTRLQESLDKWFPDWPFAKKPSFNRYTSQESKWTRKCKEHYEYVRTYLNILLDEYAYRHGNEHALDGFRIWENSHELGIPKANLKKLVIPWKNIGKKYRSNDIIASYRKQYKHLVKDPFAEYAKTKRDIPEWLDAQDLGQYMI